MAAIVTWVLGRLGTFRLALEGAAGLSLVVLVGLYISRGHKIDNLNQNLSTTQETARIAIAEKQALQQKADAAMADFAAARQEQMQRDKIAKERTHVIMSSPVSDYGPISDGLRRTLERLQ